MSTIRSSQPGISLFVLKMITIITMLCDHIGNLFFPDQIAWNCVGRFAFPVYCFLIVNGFLHTKNKFTYLFRLILFAFISQIPYIMMHLLSSGHTPALLFGNFNLVFSTLNSLFILSFGLISLIILDICRQQKPIAGHLFGLGIAGGLAVLSWMIHCEYCFLGIPLIIAFYEANLFKKSDYCKKRVIGAVIQLLLGTLALILYIFLTCITGRNEFFYALIYGICQFGALLFIFLYNGKRGCQNKFIKYCFYCFYPVHMIILVLLRVIYL